MRGKQVRGKSARVLRKVGRCTELKRTHAVVQEEPEKKGLERKMEKKSAGITEEKGVVGRRRGGEQAKNSLIFGAVPW